MQRKSGDETATHATPIAATIHGVRQVIFFCTSGLVAVNPKNGKEIWRQKFPFKVSTAAAPVVAGDLVYCSAGYGVGSGLYRISKDGSKLKSTEVWRNQRDVQPLEYAHSPRRTSLRNVQLQEIRRGPLQCIELESGEVKWSKDGYGPGNVILSGNKLIALSDVGEVAVVKANPAKYEELGRKKVISGKCWSTPVLSNGMVLARSTEEVVCLKVK